MEWINVRDRLPKPFQNVWIYWRDREVLIVHRTYIVEDETKQPPNEGWYSIEDEKCRWTNWWQPIPKPNPPTLEETLHGMDQR
jgi:hypothetical protein